MTDFDPELTPGTPEYQAKVHEWTGLHTAACANDDTCGSEAPGTSFFDDLLAAIEHGYLDSELRRLGKAARDRFYEMNPGERRVRTTSAVSRNFDPSTVSLLGEGANKVRPVQRNYDDPAAPSGHFRVKFKDSNGNIYRTNMYAKADLLNKYVKFNNHRRVPHGVIGQIVKVNKTTFEFRVVWLPSHIEAVRAAEVKQNTYKAFVEYNYDLFEK